MKDKKIYWLVEDNFNGVLYDEQVKVKKEITSTKFLIEFNRWEKSLNDGKWYKTKRQAIAEQKELTDNVCYLKIGEANG